MVLLFVHWTCFFFFFFQLSRIHRCARLWSQAVPSFKGNHRPSRSSQLRSIECQKETKIVITVKSLICQLIQSLKKNTQSNKRCHLCFSDVPLCTLFFWSPKKEGICFDSAATPATRHHTHHTQNALFTMANLELTVMSNSSDNNSSASALTITPTTTAHKRKATKGLRALFSFSGDSQRCDYWELPTRKHHTTATLARQRPLVWHAHSHSCFFLIEV